MFVRETLYFKKPKERAYRKFKSIDKYNESFRQVCDDQYNYFEKDNKHFIVDYAHTSPAIKTVVEFVKKQNFKKIYIVIGFGGDREKEKRYEMGKYLTENTNLVVFTEDNNRTESFESIMKDVQKDIINTNYLVIPNRYEAIKHVIKLMEPNTILLLIGKGIEKTKVNKEFLTDEMMINKVIYD